MGCAGEATAVLSVCHGCRVRVCVCVWVSNHCMVSPTTNSTLLYSLSPAPQHSTARTLILNSHAVHYIEWS
jgi:hypothetical protein